MQLNADPCHVDDWCFVSSISILICQHVHTHKRTRSSESGWIWLMSILPFKQKRHHPTIHTHAPTQPFIQICGFIIFREATRQQTTTKKTTCIMQYGNKLNSMCWRTYKTHAFVYIFEIQIRIKWIEQKWTPPKIGQMWTAFGYEFILVHVLHTKWFDLMCT